MQLSTRFNVGSHSVENKPPLSPSEPKGAPRLSAPSPDSVQFGSQATLLRKYGIDERANNVSIVSKTSFLSPSELVEINDNKATLIARLIQGHEHAKKGQILGTSKFSDRQYSSHMEMAFNQDGKNKKFWVLAGNFEMNISELICGERGGMTVAISKALQKLPMEWIERQPKGTKIDEMLQVKRIMMTSAKPLGSDPSAWQPCSDCCAWMGTNRFFSPDTQVLSLAVDETKKDQEAPSFNLEVRKLKDLLPFSQTRKISSSQLSIDTMPIEYSPNAQAALQASPLPVETIRQMLNTAKAEYQTGKQINQGYSGNHEAATVLFHDAPEQFTAGRVEWVPRWPDPADMTAAKKGVMALTAQGITSPNVKAIAYYGDHTDVPSVKSQGRFAQKRGSKDVMLIVVENDRIQVRTIRDYMPHAHGSVRQLSDNRKSV